jgi:hypothetical protein
MRRFGAGLGKAGGVENHRRPDLIQPVLDHARQPGSFRLATAIGNGFRPAACNAGRTRR